MYREPHVLIAGAGPVGMFASLALARHGIRAQAVDSRARACAHSYCLALHARSLRLLEEHGFAGGIWDVAYPVERIGLYDAGGRQAVIQLDCDSSIAVMPQSALENLFEAALERIDAPVSWRHKVCSVGNDRDHAIAAIQACDSQGQPIAPPVHFRTRFLMGADGHDSLVRQALGYDFPEVGPAQYYAVFEFKSSVDLAHELRLVLGERTTDVLWPLPDGCCRWSFQLPDFWDTELEQFQERMLSGGYGHHPARRVKNATSPSIDEGNLSIDHLRGLIEERAPWFRGDIQSLGWRTVVRFERRLVSSFGRGRIWLAGEAAHVTAPAGVLSMNLGLMEAAELAETFSGNLGGQRLIAALEDYDGRWMATWRRVQGMEPGLRATSGASDWVRQRAAQIASSLPAFGSDLAALAGQVKLEFASAAHTVHR